MEKSTKMNFKKISNPKNDEFYKILVVDDEKSVHAITSIVLRNFTFDGKSIELIDAYDAAEAKELLKEHSDIAIIIIDVVMETDDAGLKLVEYIRNELKNTDIRIIIRTGQAGYAPENEVVKKYDINDYKEKTELTDTKLFTTIYTGLRSYKSFMDIKKLQEELIKNEASLRRAEEIAKVGSWELDLVTNEITLSHTLVELFKLNLMQRKFDISSYLNFIHIDDLEYVKSSMENAIENQKPYSVEYRVVLPDKKIHFISGHGEIIVDENGNAIKIFGVSQDITARKKAEEIAKENEKMQKKILEQQQIEQEQKAISDAKDSFLLLFTHELKTPLNAIINFTKYLLKHTKANTIQEVPYEKKIKLFEQIEFSALRMLEDITNILDLSRLKSHKLSYNYSSFNPYEVLENVVNEHESLIREYQTKVMFKTDDLNIKIKSDEYRFKQILSNIISNAVKYSNSLVHLTLTCDGMEYIISIEDNGEGIEDKEKVFALFEQVDDYVVTKSQVGTGIGLHFVKLLCDGLHIKYSLEKSSELGGLKFDLIIKLDNEG